MMNAILKSHQLNYVLFPFLYNSLQKKKIDIQESEILFEAMRAPVNYLSQYVLRSNFQVYFLQIFINQQDWKIQRNIDFETKKIVIIIINIIVTKGSCITNFNS